jgi:beta-carotene ketolase (CrtO type)
MSGADTGRSVDDVIVIGGGHNGLVCAAYLTQAGLSVTVLEQGETVGGCIATCELDDGAGRFELGAYEIGGLFGSGVAGELELVDSWGLRIIERDELLYAPHEGAEPLALHRDLTTTVELLADVVGRADAERYRDHALWSRSVMNLLGVLERGPAPSIQQLAALAETSLGAEGHRLVQALLAPASTLLRSTFNDERLQGVLGHWSSHAQQSPSDPGTGVGVFKLAGLHGHGSIRASGGSGAVTEALRRCVEGNGGAVVTGARVVRVDVDGGRATAVHASGNRYVARRAVVSAIDARRLFALVDARHTTPSVRRELSGIHTGHGNVTELKVDAIVRNLPTTSPAGFERAMMTAPGRLADLERSFAEIRTGRVPTTPPVMVAFPSVLEPGWAPAGSHAVWIQTFVPWTRDDGGWDEVRLEDAALRVLSAVDRALGVELEIVHRRATGPAEWNQRLASANPSPNHIDMTIDQLLNLRPCPSMSSYRTPIAGLYLTGAGTHPGGGVTGAPGRNTANRVLSDLGITGRRTAVSRVKDEVATLRDALRAVRSLRRR